MKNSTKNESKVAGVGFSADFKPARQHRTIKIADDKTVQKAAARSAQEFSTTFEILSK